MKRISSLLAHVLITASLVATSQSNQAEPVPSSRGVNSASIIHLRISNQGDLWLDDEQISAAEWPQRLRMGMIQSPRLAVQIDAAEDTPYRYVHKVYIDASAQSVSKIGLVTHSRSGVVSLIPLSRARDSDPVKLRIKSDGSMYWSGTPVDEAGLRGQLAVVGGSGQPRRIEIAVDDGVLYTQVARLLALAREYGATNIGDAQASEIWRHIQVPVAPQPLVNGAASADTEYNGRIPPKYPPIAILQRHEGTAQVSVLVGVDGGPKEVKLEASSGYVELDRAAMEVVHKWRFNAAIRNGQKVEDYAQVPVVFDLNEL